MALRIILVGATGWVGRALVPAITAADDLALVGAVGRRAAGSDIGETVGIGRLGVTTSATLTEALATPCDVVIDYTKPDVVKHHVLQALAHGCHVVVGTSGLGADDYAKIDTAARSQERGVIAAGNFSITATLLKRFALEAARFVPDVEILDYASPGKPDTPSGTARELAELLGEVRQPPTAKPVAELAGIRETRGGARRPADPGAGPFRAHALLRAVLRGGARGRQRTARPASRRGLVRCPLRRRHPLGGAPRRRLRRPEARSRHGHGLASWRTRQAIPPAARRRQGHRHDDRRLEAVRDHLRADRPLRLLLRIPTRFGGVCSGGSPRRCSSSSSASRGRARVPLSWIAFGILITAVDHWTSGGRSVMINILINFALLRLGAARRGGARDALPSRLALVVAASAALIPALDPVLEYGGGGWLWALFGLAHRLFVEGGGDAARRRNLLAVAAGLAYVVRERSDYGFDAVQSALLAVFIAVLVLCLTRFRRESLSWQPHAAARRAVLLRRAAYARDVRRDAPCHAGSRLRHPIEAAERFSADA